MDEKQEMMALPCWRGGDAHPFAGRVFPATRPPGPWPPLLPGSGTCAGDQCKSEQSEGGASPRIARRRGLGHVSPSFLHTAASIALWSGHAAPAFSFSVSRVGLVRKSTTKRSGRPLAGGLRALESGQGQRWSDNSARAKSQDGPLFPDGSPPNPATCRLAKPLASEGNPHSEESVLHPFSGQTIWKRHLGADRMGSSNIAGSKGSLSLAL